VKETAAAPASRRDLAWIAGPFFIVGVFFVAYVAAGLPGLQPSLRILAGAAGLALAAAAGRGIAHPWPSAFFWGGAFWAYAGRLYHPLAIAGGVVVALVGGALYLVLSRRSPPNPEGPDQEWSGRR
jgi:hypothetical protein